MSTIRNMSNHEFADYLRRVGDDYGESGNDATAEDYAEAARRIDTMTIARPAPKWERITAGDVQVGDRISSTRDAHIPPMTVTGFGPEGKTARYIETDQGRIRPRYTTKLWRIV